MVRRAGAKKQSGTTVQLPVSTRRELIGAATLVIPGRLSGWNELLDAKAAIAGFNKLKTAEMQKIALFARAQRFPYVRRAWFWYQFFERDERRDPSNVIGGGIKIIEDALQRGGFLEGDGRRNIIEIRAKVLTDRDNPRVELCVLAPLEEEKSHGH